MDFGVTGKLWEYGIGSRTSTMKEKNADRSFAEIAATKAAEKEASLRSVKWRYGAGVSVQNVGKDQSSIDRIGAGTAGTGNVVIASNILEQMANDPEKAAYYEGKIQNYFNSVPRYQAELSSMGHEIHSSGIVIHPDGTVTHYISGDLKPEVRAKIEAKMKAEDEEKAKRKRQYQEHSQKAAEERKQQMELLYKKQSVAGLQVNDSVIWDNGRLKRGVQADFCRLF